MEEYICEVTYLQDTCDLKRRGFVSQFRICWSSFLLKWEKWSENIINCLGLGRQYTLGAIFQHKTLNCANLIWVSRHSRRDLSLPSRYMHTADMKCMDATEQQKRCKQWLCARCVAVWCLSREDPEFYNESAGCNGHQYDNVRQRWIVRNTLTPNQKQPLPPMRRMCDKSELKWRRSKAKKTAVFMRGIIGVIVLFSVSLALWMLAVNIIYLNKSIMHLSDIGSYFDRPDIIWVAAFVKSHWMVFCLTVIVHYLVSTKTFTGWLVVEA